MAKYVVLMNWTAEGIKKVKESPARLDKARELAKAEGVTIGAFYMVMGEYDLVSVVEAPDDAAMARVALRLGAGGAISTKTLKAFSEDEYRKLTSAV